jgi:hypothetical protein
VRQKERRARPLVHAAACAYHTNQDSRLSPSSSPIFSAVILWSNSYFNMNIHEYS